MIAAWDYADGSKDTAWLEKNYAGIRRWAEQMLSEDRDGNGLIEYHAGGNSGYSNTATATTPLITPPATTMYRGPLYFTLFLPGIYLKNYHYFNLIHK